MLALGLRPGEALGLSWDAVNLPGKLLTVRQALKRESNELVIGDVKTATSRRSINLPSPVVKACVSTRHDSQRNDSPLAIYSGEVRASDADKWTMVGIGLALQWVRSVHLGPSANHRHFDLEQQDRRRARRVAVDHPCRRHLRRAFGLGDESTRGRQAR